MARAKPQSAAKQLFSILRHDHHSPNPAIWGVSKPSSAQGKLINKTAAAVLKSSYAQFLFLLSRAPNTTRLASGWRITDQNMCTGWDVEQISKRSSTRDAADIVHAAGVRRRAGRLIASTKNCGGRDSSGGVAIRRRRVVAQDSHRLGRLGHARDWRTADGLSRDGQVPPARSVVSTGFRPKGQGAGDSRAGPRRRGGNPLEHAIAYSEIRSPTLADARRGWSAHPSVVQSGTAALRTPGRPAGLGRCWSFSRPVSLAATASRAPSGCWRSPPPASGRHSAHWRGAPSPMLLRGDCRCKPAPAAKLSGSRSKHHFSF